MKEQSLELRRKHDLKKAEQLIFMKLRPLGDKVVLKYQEAEEKTQSGIILPDSAKEKPQEAAVADIKEDAPAVQPQLKMY